VQGRKQMNAHVNEVLHRHLNIATAERVFPGPWWDVYRDVYEAGNWAVDRAVDRAVAQTMQDDPNHPVLETFLFGIKETCTSV